YFDQMGLINFAKITLGINEVSSYTRVINYDGEDTKLSRLISVIQNFDAEFEFVTKLKRDGTLDNITLNIYKKNDNGDIQGVGQNRNDVLLSFGDNISGVSRKVEKAQIFNSIYVTGKDGLSWKDSAWSVTNSEGKEEFYKRAGESYAKAPLSAQMFPSQLQSSSGDIFTNKNETTEYTTVNAMWGYALSQLKQYAYPLISYEVTATSNLTVSSTGDGMPLHIGDTVRIQDKNFIDSDGNVGLFLSARVSELEISFTNPTSNKIMFSNYIKLKSEVSDDLTARMQEIINANTPYRPDITSTNGLQFKNGTGTTTLGAHIYFGSDDKETTADSYEWSKDGTVVANAQTITVDASGVVDKAVYSFKATVAGKVVASQSVTITNVNDGATGAQGPRGLKGDPGATGIPGRAGVDGKTSYLHIAYATNSTGTAGFGVSNATGKTYIGQYTDFTSADSTDPSKYTWSLIKGDKGDKGDQGAQGIQGLQGPAGTQGVPGPKGADGKTQYTHIAYANSPDGNKDFSTSDSNRAYIGMYVDFNINDSNTPSDYSWTLVKGADGTQGTPGKPGADGKTPYFHTAWSYSADGMDRFTTVYPRFNLLKNTKNLTATSTSSSWGTLFSSSQIYDSAIKSKSGVSTMNFNFDVHVPLNATIGGAISLQLKGQTYQAHGNVGTNDFNTIVGQSWHDIEQSDLGKTIRLSFPIQIDTKYKTFDSALADTDSIVIRQMKDTSGLVYYNIKLEEGSITTPYMPSSSEVTTADYPRYIGQYSNFMQADSTNPSDYTWSLMRGNDGKDGADGKDGIAGKDGKGIKATAITYQASTNGTTAPTGTWSASVPTVAKGSFLWTRTIWTYTDNTIETGYAVAYMGTNGNNGTNGIAGKDGVGIKTMTITYAGSTSGTTSPTSGWTTTVPTVAAGSYLWTKTVWTYTDNTSETGYSVAKMGNNGTPGPQGPQGPPGSNGDPGKTVSNTEPTTRFKGLTWKYSGTTDLTASDGTVIKPNTEYYYNGTHWMINFVEANQIKVNDLSAISGTYTNGSIKNVTIDGSVTSTILIEKKHILFTFSDSSQNTTNTLELDSQQGYANTFVDSNSGRTRTVQANFQGFFTSDTDGPSAQLTPYGVYVTNGLQTTTVSLGSGINATLAKIGQMCQISINSNSSNVPAGNGVALSGNIPAGWRPAIMTPFEVMMYHGTSFQRPLHITIGTDGKISIVNASASSYWCFGGTTYMLA
ncbi:DUF7013 family protein, partial [Lactococcus lactis]|uniref:DUF7013 family protein n=1 Tax=Lactococcus lactis TaxID=1358 RepID=UPI0021B138FD